MFYNTKQREMILSLLKNNNTNTHLTADKITEKLKKTGFNVGKTTVYRYLERLSVEGRVRKYPDKKGSCYQYIEDLEACAGHFHFKCDKCGELFHTDCDLLADISRHLNSDHRFLIDSSKTVFYGSCEKCVKQTS